MLLELHSYMYAYLRMWLLEHVFHIMAPEKFFAVP